MFLDGEFTFGIHQNLLLKIGLHTGDEISPVQVNDYKRQDQLLAAKDAAYRLLQYRQRSIHEMRTRLGQKDFSADIVDAVVDELIERDLLNDRKFAQIFAEDQLSRKNIGPIRLRAELQKKYLSKQIISEVVEKIYQKYDIREQAELAAEKKRKSLARLDSETAYRRLTSYLARRGFSWDIISDIVSPEDFI